MRFISWLELAASAMKHLGLEGISTVTLHPMPVNDSHTWLGVTMNGRWLRGNDGRLTVFDSEESASRFLHLLKLERFSYGLKCKGEHLSRIHLLSLDGGRLSTGEEKAREVPVKQEKRRSAGRGACTRERKVKDFITARQGTCDINEGDHHD